MRKQNSILNELNAKLDQLYRQKESVISSRLLSLQKELENLISQRSRIEESPEESNKSISKLKNYENISAETVSEITMLLREEKQVEEMLLLEQTRLAEFQEKCDELSDSLEPDELFEKRWRMSRQPLIHIMKPRSVMSLNTICRLSISAAGCLLSSLPA